MFLPLACSLALVCATAMPAVAKEAAKKAEATEATKKAEATEAAAAELRDPQALAALDKMGQALRSLKAFSLTSDATTEVVLDDGQKIELDEQVRYRVQQPDKLFVEISSDRKQRQVYFDGKQLVIYAPRLKYYAKADTQAHTLGELVINAAEKYGIEFPLADMFFWGTEHAPKDQIQEAAYVGPATLDSESVDQYAFRQEDADWQVWISQETSLPKKLVIISGDDPSLPQYRAQLHWDTRTPVDATVFQFSPPADAHQLKLVKTGVAVVEEK
jgi:hypothetical protein